jgi:hypothetical protein
MKGYNDELDNISKIKEFLRGLLAINQSNE